MKTNIFIPGISRDPVIEKIKIDRDFVSEIIPELASGKNSAVLASSLNSDIGRFSYVGLSPFLIFKSKKDNIEISSASGVKKIKGDPFFYLNVLFEKNKVNNPTKLPFVAGGIGYFSYDLKNNLEKLPQKAKDDLGAADIYFVFYQTVLVHDNHNPHELYISVLKVNGEDTPVKKIISGIKERISKKLNSLEAAPLHGFRGRYTSNFKPEGYMKAVDKVIDYIYEGDVFQINLSQRFKANWPFGPGVLFSKLNKVNPAPFGAYLNFDDLGVVSSSPELFLKYSAGVLETRPMKGTRRKIKDPARNKINKLNLMQSDKDASELSMIVDLERNDLGKVCIPGTVKVSQHRRLEEYSTVFQTVSIVRGKKIKSVNMVEAVKALYPGGSITGCPKIRAMEIIDELEPHTRGVYTGSIGYLSFHDTMQLNIAIRTIILKDKFAYFHVGGGIVADSDAKAEYQETLDKAAALIKTLNCSDSRSRK